MSRQQLEATLAAQWDRETLAVYADHLQGEGDPRGELIALDLELESRSSPELVARRSSLLSAWLGPLAPSDPHEPWIGDSFRYGFLDNLVLDAPLEADRLAAMLDSPLAPYIKRVSLHGDAAHAATALAALATRRHAWLSELAVRLDDVGPVDAAAVTAFIAATPALARLEIVGHHVFETFSHPALRRLAVIGDAAFPPLYDGDDALAGVEELRFEIWPPRSETPRASAIEPFCLPGLRRLDLSANEPALRGVFQPDYDYDYDDVYDGLDDDPEVPTALDVLASQAIRGQLTHVVLPSIRSATELDLLETIVADMRQLEQIEIARGHYLTLPAKLERSPARFVRPPPWPWPRPGEIPDGDSVHVVIPGTRSGDTATLADAAAYMERHFETLDADTRYAWTRFWVLVAELDQLPWKSDPKTTWTDERALPAEILVAALECDIGGSGGWRELRDSLRYRRPFPPGAMLTIHRVRAL